MIRPGPQSSLSWRDQKETQRSTSPSLVLFVLLLLLWVIEASNSFQDGQFLPERVSAVRGASPVYCP